MKGSAIPGALVAGGVCLVLLYGAVWAMLLVRTDGASAAGHVSGVVDDAQAPAETDGVTYRVETADGEEHLVTVPAADPALVLQEASRRFGEIRGVTRLPPRQAHMAQRAEARPSRRVYPLMGLLFIFPLAMFWAASRLRRRERALGAVWTALNPGLSGQLPALARATGLTPAEVLRQAREINERGWADLAYHPEQERIADARLEQYGVTIPFCPLCNEPAAMRARADLVNVPRCPACMSEYPREQLQELVLDTAGKLRRSPEEGKLGQDFSPGIFAAFTLLFPPLAIFHALRA
ncbi:MAG: hypothetical protein PVI30_05830 [Myxococcales bacterium]|jgi:hypothetical protein